MKCELCDTSNNVRELPCGHAYHIKCLRRHVHDWTIPCIRCCQPLARAHHDGHHWYIGIDTRESMECLFKVSNESKLVSCNKCFSHWRRRNGRLSRRQSLPLKSNICVS
ncbi:hypothetical protein N9A45_01260 [bacterium]|nr:hypothetical protein [bacterium]